MNIHGDYSGWAYREVSPLREKVVSLYEKMFGKKPNVLSIHAGLECGWHIRKAPHLDMVSIGVTNRNIHSPKETLDLTTVAPQIRLVMETLHRIAKTK